MLKTCKGPCGLVKEITEFNPASRYKDKIYYRGECKVCNLAKQASNQTAQIKYRTSENGKTTKAAYKKTEKYKEYSREYEKNRIKTPERRQRMLEWTKQKLKEDPLFRLRFNCRNRLRNALKAKKWHKISSFNQYIGCTLEELRKHLESKFIEGMSWENYGEWELDHVIPISSAKTQEEMYKLCHFSNLQPLWREDNIKKGNKIIIK